MKTILVPTDFSELANNATEIAVQMAQRVNADLMLLHVVEDTSIASIQYTGELALPDADDRLFVFKLIEKAKKAISAFKEKYPKVKIIEELRVGNPYYSVQDIIKEYEIDLIVMGTKGATGAVEILVGSNAEKVVRHATCPVLTVHDKIDIDKIKTIAFATGLKDAQGKHIEILKSLEVFMNAKTQIVRVNTPNNFQADRDSLRELKEYAENCGLKNYEVNVYNDITEEEGIIHFADDIDAGMIVMATHGRTGLAHLLAGSIAEEVVNHTTRPVLTFVMKH